MRALTRMHVDAALLITAITSACATAVNPVELPPVEPPAVSLPVQEDSTRFAVIGDTGTGGIDQWRLAQQLIAVHSKFPFEFVLMTGDNMYGRSNDQDYIYMLDASLMTLLAASVQFYCSPTDHH